MEPRRRYRAVVHEWLGQMALATDQAAADELAAHLRRVHADELRHDWEVALRALGLRLRVAPRSVVVWLRGSALQPALFEYQVRHAVTRSGGGG